MGSGGRGESLLFPDQDHGFVLADYPDEQHGEIDPWFIELAERFTATLDRLHFPLCDGGRDGHQPALAQDAAAVAPTGGDLDARAGAGDAPALRHPVRLPLRLRRLRAGRRPTRVRHRRRQPRPWLSRC
jgi:hypothetical protein